MDNPKNKEKLKGTTLAGKTFTPSDYNSSSELESGLAMTHEQVNDTLMEGTIDGEIDDLSSKTIPRKEE
ncbi:YozQ family protein [Lederbergia graminis]|uniref:YozQ family protein n=1 Tax=Lederbergia graminis TaxID=735518 RepID=A0ABW0LEE1_9BACI